MANDFGRRATYWSRWPHEQDGPFWAGIHLDERVGVVAVVGIELFSEPPAQARTSLGPAGDPMDDLSRSAPLPIRADDIRNFPFMEILNRFRNSSPEAAELAGPPGNRPLHYTDMHWRLVAGMVERTRAGGSHATARAVAETWVVSRSTAKKWIARCRELGLLSD